MPEEELEQQQKPKRKAGFFQNLLALLLFVFFIISLSALVVLMDFIGVINFRRKLPPKIRENMYVQEYIKKANLLDMSEEERLKVMIESQNKTYEEQQDQLKKLEHNIEEKLKAMSDYEKQYASKKKELDEADNKLEDMKKEMQELEKQKKQYQDDIRSAQLDDLTKQEKLKQLAVIYEKMEPEAAGLTFNDMDDDLAIDILMTMKESKAAEIMNNMNAEKVVKIAEKLKSKGIWRNK
ncbi:MAG: hypothetical protein C0601_09745 [Candidatus Muiribacterium halophilum]|uniref:Magnesium transporter MgtE intracellular domain-containing protein n=1 Tax=Muiribacterium halophilum TaxID=2053465 RepID=A0A2N5ZDL2_MUIH1|nr:MAG: hypothetical protein C0601_09745 [Candidatus Muirbacterium halophilum]